MKLWKYKHYKNKNYELLFVWKHSDTLEDFIVYKALYNSEEFGDDAIWVKPLKEFCTTVVVDNKKIDRFKYIWG
jgi:hypothetical protein